MPLRFSFCAGIGLLLAVAATILGILINIGQINGTVVPRHIRLAYVDTTGLNNSVSIALSNVPLDVTNLYGNPGDFRNLAPQTGLRPIYQWGLWSACSGYEGLGGQVACNSTHRAYEFRPFDALIHDVRPAYASNLTALVGDGNTFANSAYTGRFTRAAFYLILVGVVLAGLAFLISIVAHHVAFLLAALVSFLAFLCLAVGAVIWTIILSRMRNAINDRAVSIDGTQNVPVGIKVEYGNGLWMLWGAVGATLLATVPLIVGCLTRRPRTPY